jgi:hypothetical protein
MHCLLPDWPTHLRRHLLGRGHRALQERSLAKHKLVIPMRVQRDCDVPLPLQTRQYIDFSDPADYAPSFKQLQESIRARRGVVAPTGNLPRYNNLPATAPQSAIARWYPVLGRNCVREAGGTEPLCQVACSRGLVGEICRKAGCSKWARPV